MFTKLNNRTLWFDGDSVYPASKLMDLITQTDVQFVDVMTDDVREFNELAQCPIKVKTTLNELDFDWNIPNEFKTISILEYVAEKVYDEYHNSPELEGRMNRVVAECAMYERMGLIDVLRATIYMISNLTSRGTVWGVGRGSCVSSYVLYLIGVHDIDSYYYQLDITDFLNEESEHE